MFRILALFLLLVNPASAQYIYNSGGGSGGGSGTVTSLSVVTANGFAGTVATATTTPAITLTTSITGNVCGNGTALSACSTTGTGATVLQTTPTLITPVLGVATGTSLALGGATLGSNALAVTGQVTNTGGTITTSQPFTISQTWNAGGVTFNGLLLDITSTASAASSTSFVIKVGGSTVFSVNKLGTAISAFGFYNSAETQGIDVSSASGLRFYGQSVDYATTSAAFQARSDKAIGWSSTTSSLGSPDTLLSRNAAGVTQFGTTTANAAGSLLATSGTFSSFVRAGTGSTVAGLPAAGTAGRRAYVTDQLTVCAAIGAALTGGGAVVCPVFDNGTIWVGG